MAEILSVASVWKEEVNKALIEYTKKAIQFVRNGEPYDLPVQMRKPDESLKMERYPCITWYNLMDLPNTYRADNIERSAYNEKTGNVVSYYEATPFDMYYQIDFWGKLWGDVDLMSQKWLQSLPPYSYGKYFNLPVIDSNGNSTTVMCVQKDILRRRDTLTDGQKILHSTMTYAVQGYLGRDYTESEDVILDVNLKKTRF